MDSGGDGVARAFDDEQREEIRARLVSVATRAAVGGQRVSVGELARAAGIAKGSFYRFFPSLEALWAEVAERRHATGAVALRAASHDREEPVRAVLAAAVRLASEGAGPADGPSWRALCDGLVERGAVHAGRRDVFLAVPAVVAGLASQRAALGPRWDDVADAVVRGFAAALVTPP